MGISGDAAIAIQWAAFAVTFPFVGLRIFTRFQAGRLGSSDLIVSLTWLMFLLTNTGDNELWRRGLYQDSIGWGGEWEKAIPDANTRVTLLKIKFAAYFPYILQLWGVKLSIIALYYTLITDQFAKLRLALHCITAYCIATLLISVILNLFWCTPLSKNWGLVKDSHDKCFHSIVPYVVPLTFHISSDFVLYLLPFVLLKSLRTQLPQRQFIGVIGLIALGGIYILISVGRYIANAHRVKVPTLAVWTAVEMLLGLIIVCCPALGMFGSRRKRSDGSIHLQTRPNDSSCSGKDGEPVQSWFNTRTRTASRASENLYTHRGSVDHSDIEMDCRASKTQSLQSSKSNNNQRRSGRSSQQRFLPRISQSRESLVQEPVAAYHTCSPLPAAGSTPIDRRKLSRDAGMYPPSEFKVEESLRQNNGNVQESVNALRDDILRSISFAYDEQSYNHEHHTHSQGRKTSREGWR